MTRAQLIKQALIGIAVLVATASPTLSSEAPQQVQLTGCVRDFIEKAKPNGHPDFENKPSAGFSIYCKNVATTLGPQNRPVLNPTLGYKITTQWKDNQNRPICYTLFGQPGDVAGVQGVQNNGGITSAASFEQWFKDVPGVNLSMPLTLTLVRNPDGKYVFDDKIDPEYASLGGFFPIDGELFGNSGPAPNGGAAPDHNYHFTFELHTNFTYDADANQVFQFIGDDDVWVFIDGKLVIDLGGVHSAKEQFVDLDRLDLVDGQTYPLSFFFAERHRTASNFRIETNLVLSTPNYPSVTAAFD